MPGCEGIHKSDSQPCPDGLHIIGYANLSYTTCCGLDKHAGMCCNFSNMTRSDGDPMSELHNALFISFKVCCKK